MTTPSASVSVNRNGLGVSPFSGGDVIAVIGPASAGAFDTPKSLGSSANIRTEFPRGPLPQLATFIREAKVKDQPLGRPIVCVRCKTSTAGNVGDIDVSDFAGTAVPTKGTTTSDDDYELGVRFPSGGAVKAAGITYQVTRDGGRRWGPVMALGTGHTIAIPDSGGVTFTLEPPEAEFVAFVANLRTKALAHFGYTTGGVHLAADTTSDDGIGSAPTDWATGIARLNEIRAGLILHATNNTAHTADDTTSFASLPAVAVTKHEAVDLGIALDAAFAAHLGTTGSVHGAVDAANVLTEDAPTHGTVEDDDAFAADATSPRPSEADLDDALAALQATRFRWDLAVVATPITTTSERGAIEDRVDTWETAKRYRPVIVSFRLRGANETAGDYLAAWKAVFDPSTTDAIVACYDGGFARSRIDNLHRYRRPAAWGVALKAVAAAPGEDLAFVDNGLGAIPDFTILDDNGNLAFHDEAEDPGADDSRACTLRTVDGYEGTFITNPKTLAQAGTDLYLLQYYRAVSKGVASVNRTLTGLLSVQLAPDSSTGRLEKQEVEDLQNNTSAAAERDVVTPGWASAVSAAIDNTANLFQVPEIPVEVSITPFLYAKSWKVTIGLKNPFATQS